MHDAAYKEELREVRKEVEKVRSWVEQVLSSRETDRNSKVPDEANTLFQNELADVKKENGKLKEEQLRAAAAAEAEAARLAQLAAQHQAHIERLEQELEALKARLEQKSAQINRLENARDEAAEGYRTPQRYTEQHHESESEDGSDKSETRAAATRFYKNYDFDDEGGVNPHAQSTVDYLTALARQVEAKQKSRKGKRAVNLYKKQGATPSTHRTPVSGGPRRRDQVEPTGETPTQPNTRSKGEEK
jgi:chromosome segregation ATPase